MNRSRRAIARRISRLGFAFAGLVGTSLVTVPTANAQSPARPRPGQQVVLRLKDTAEVKPVAVEESVAHRQALCSSDSRTKRGFQ